MKSTYVQYLKKNIYKIVAIILFGDILGSGISLCQIPVYKRAITYLLNGGDEREKSQLFLAGIFIITVYIISIMFTQYFHPAFLVHCKEYMRKEYIRKSIQQPVSAFDNKTNGEFIVNYNNIEDVTSYVFDYAALITSGLSIVILIGYIMVTVHWELVVLLIGMVVVLFLVQGITQMLENKQEEVISKEEKVVELMDSSVKHITILKSFQYENDFKKNFDYRVDELYEVQKQKNVITNVIELVQQLSKVIVMLGTPLFCLYLAQRKIVEPSAVIVASFSFFIIANSLIQVITNIKNIAEKKQKFVKLDNFFVYKENDKCGTYQVNGNENSLTLQNVTIRNGENTLIENCTTQFPKSGVVAIYGQSGIGKSSLLKTIAGHKSLDSGQIVFCDKQKQIISYAPQDSILFSGDLLENLKYAREGTTDEEINQVVRQLNVEDRIKDLRDGLHTKITSEKELSGGQRQIINLCRAFLKPAKIVLLDEPTSSQSRNMEEKMLHGIKALSTDKLCIVVSHSEAVKQIADLVYVIQDKRLKKISGE